MFGGAIMRDEIKPSMTKEQETARERAIEVAAKLSAGLTPEMEAKHFYVHDTMQDQIDSYIAGARAHSLDHPVIAQLEAALKSAQVTCRAAVRFGELNGSDEFSDALEALSKARGEGK